MKEIRMVDLIGQYEHIKEEINHRIQKILDTASFIGGDEVLSFEKGMEKYLETDHVVSCANGTDALMLALMSLPIPQGAEVIVPDFTFVATSEVVKLLNFTPVLIDVDESTFNIKVDQIEEAITDKTAAIMPVHLFGQCADMEPILEIAKKNDLFVIEDAAQALGAVYTFSDGSCKKAGTMGHIGCTSFFPSKNLGGMGDGGAIFTNDEELAQKLRILKNHGMSSEYQYKWVGVNSRLDGIQAAILNVKLNYLDEYNRKRQEAAQLYDEALQDNPKIIIPQRSNHSTHIFHQYTLKILDSLRNELKSHLDKNQIPCKIYYSEGIHEHEVYNDCKYDTNKLSNTLRITKEVLSLPMHTELTREQIDFITEKINQFFN